MLETELFSPIDIQTGTFLQKALKSDDQDLLLFLCYLAASFRQGCLFVSCIEGSIVPAPEETMRDALVRGYTVLQTLADSPYIMRDGYKVFFSSAATLIVELSKLAEKITKAAPHLALDDKLLQQSVATLMEQNILLPEQAAAICESAKNGLSCIWGGPGTGKTYTAGWLVKLFLEQHPSARIVLAAPTGKAAANLQESIQRAVGLKLAQKLEAKTLHSLLGLKRVASGQKKLKVGYDLILVDESSMIDASLCLKLLSAVPESSRIVFLGDPFQLPPIEPGEPFVAFVQDKKAKGTSGELITTKRQENRAIIDLAEAVKAGHFDDAMNLLWQDKSGVITLSPLDNTLNLDSAVELASSTAESRFNPDAFVKQLYSRSNQSVEAFFSTLLQTRILCPQRVGPFGTIAINSRMLDAAKGSNLQPIIITKNDYTLGLTNGQVGVISGQVAYFEHFEEAATLRQIPKVLLSSYETAYCLSVHKSQGSEFGHVALLLPEGSERFGRKMLYTAITRAKKSLTIYGSPLTLKACITNEGRPMTTSLVLS